MIEYTPAFNDEREDEGDEVRFWNMSSIGASSKVSAQQTTERIEDLPLTSVAPEQMPLDTIPLEDPNTPDRAEWEEMLSDNPPPPSANRKRKVRNNSVSL